MGAGRQAKGAKRRMQRESVDMFEKSGFHSPEWKKNKSATNPITCGRRIRMFSNPVK